MPYNEECEQQQELYWNEVFDEDDDDIFGDDAYREQLNDSNLMIASYKKLTDRLRRVRENVAYDWEQEHMGNPKKASKKFPELKKNSN